MAGTGIASGFAQHGKHVPDKGNLFDGSGCDRSRILRGGCGVGDRRHRGSNIDIVEQFAFLVPSKNATLAGAGENPFTVPGCC